MAARGSDGKPAEDDPGSGETGAWPDETQAADFDRALDAWRAKLTGGLSPIALSLAWLDWAGHLAGMPARQAQLANRAWNNALKLARPALDATGPPAGAAEQTGAAEPTGAAEDPRAGDPRFAGPGWRQWPFSVFSQTFLQAEEWWREATTDVPGVSPHHEAMVAFWTRQLLDMASPSNFLFSNPEVLRRTLDQRGGNLLRGAQLFAGDLPRALSGEPPVGAEAFTPGEEVAVTPGKVIYRNRLIELIQYEPTTETVHAEPVLIVSAPIMKYYILDLSPHNSLVKYLVDSGHTVFAVSWLNPSGEDRDLSMEDYHELGVMAALDAVVAIVGDRRVHAVGYCLGGTMMSIAAAAMARDGDERLRSLTLLATETDFTEPGEIGLFVDESQVTHLENLMAETGYLESSQMGGSFQMLRSYELIYSRIVSEYLLGERQLPNDLMAWNADGTRLPYRMHSEYLRGMFLGNDLFEGRHHAGGRRVSLSDIREPMFLVGTMRDHVVPWRSVYKLNLVAEAELTFVLTSAGHNAGIVSEPGHRNRRFQLLTRAAGAAYVDPDVWLAEAPTHEGSWWTAWEAWLTERSSGRVAPPPMGAPDRGYGELADAPGTYVLQR
ncbi:MAG: PHA/PHB synthase family protein [Solirubrobacteraceae bacterium]